MRFWDIQHRHERSSRHPPCALVRRRHPLAAKRGSSNAVWTPSPQAPGGRTSPKRRQQTTPSVRGAPLQGDLRQANETPANYPIRRRVRSAVQTLNMPSGDRGSRTRGQQTILAPAGVHGALRGHPLFKALRIIYSVKGVHGGHDSRPQTCLTCLRHGLRPLILKGRRDAETPKSATEYGSAPAAN